MLSTHNTRIKKLKTVSSISDIYCTILSTDSTNSIKENDPCSGFKYNSFNIAIIEFSKIEKRRKFLRFIFETDKPSLKRIKVKIKE